MEFPRIAYPVTFPAITRTKAEALALADEIMPTTQAALANLKRSRPDIEHPRYYLDFANADRLREVFEWLASKQTRVYKRAQWPLFYTLAQRIIREADENGQGKVRDIYCAPLAARTLDTSAFGDGDGI